MENEKKKEEVEGEEEDGLKKQGKEYSEKGQK